MLNLTFESHSLENIGVYPQILGTIGVSVLKYFETIMFYAQISGKSWRWSQQYWEDKWFLFSNKHINMYFTIWVPNFGKKIIFDSERFE